MIKITDELEVGQLIASSLAPGIFSNHTLSGDAVERAVKENNLYMIKMHPGVLFFRKYDGTWRMTGAFLPDSVVPEMEERTVTEIAFREKDAEKAEFYAQKICGAGFHILFLRKRRTRQKLETLPEGLEPVLAGPGDEPAVRQIMKEAFDPDAGCVPNIRETQTIVQEGKVLCVRGDKGDILGILHFETANLSSEIRHLAVREDCRGRGIAQKLLDMYAIRTEGRKSHVWTRLGNTAAEHIYEKNGYKADGYQSMVLLHPGKETYDGRTVEDPAGDLPRCGL